MAFSGSKRETRASDGSDWARRLSLNSESCILHAPIVLKYQFVTEHAEHYPIQRMCAVLGVSVSGYDAWHKQAPSTRVREDGRLSEQISDIFVANRKVYGSPRIHAELRALGICCSRKRMIRLMQQLDLSVLPPRRQMSTTCHQRGKMCWPNVLNRQFEADRPNRTWVCDVTAIWTQEGWLYLAIVLDLFSRMVVGWSMGTHHDEALIEAALSMLMICFITLTREPSPIKPSWSVEAFR